MGVMAMLRQLSELRKHLLKSKVDAIGYCPRASLVSVTGTR